MNDPPTQPLERPQEPPAEPPVGPESPDEPMFALPKMDLELREGFDDEGNRR